ncbi:transaldolase [Wenxinia saemankumensis]|uniref:Transaldolase n=1 Tax=Wenxinia saemankumensis TaxID=1447782 RepID=A0A1M6H1T2_9RHOB|nr:transaldolase [Wenxinia saemankumensis]SHJ16105.1 transaldolase [Wenxinia saemankumensis]
MTNRLDQLKDMTIVVADTGDIEAVKAHKPQDCTTNPSLVLKAVQDDAFKDTFREAVAKGGSTEDIAQDLVIRVGSALAGIVPGYVSTEVASHLSFDTEGSIASAHSLIEAYDKQGVGKDRILIKLASTWEGIRAAEKLEREGIRCNLTLLFSMAQAVACADAGVTLISPFVGRITDWYKSAEGVEGYEPENDPGVKSVREIYDYYKSAGIETIVMGASFRNAGQIAALAGCDRLTISPDLLKELSEDETPLERVLSPEGKSGGSKRSISEAEFRWELNEDAMATEKLAEGIRKFHADGVKLAKMIEGAR